MLRGFLVVPCFQILLPQCADLAGPADQAGELGDLVIFPEQG